MWVEQKPFAFPKRNLGQLGHALSGRPCRVPQSTKPSHVRRREMQPASESRVYLCVLFRWSLHAGHARLHELVPAVCLLGCRDEQRPRALCTLTGSALLDAAHAGGRGVSCVGKEVDIVSLCQLATLPLTVCRLHMGTQAHAMMQRACSGDSPRLVRP